MKKLVSGLMLLLVSVGAARALTVTVTPQGDGVGGKERWSFGTYYSVDVNVNTSPNKALHWSESGDAQSLETYMQIALESLPAAENITAATLYINVLSTGGNGCKLYHAANSSTANGNAAQKIGATEFIAAINGVTGWVGLDVTNAIRNDVTAGYGYSAFKFANNSYSSVTFSSGESGDFAPYLSVVPEPATLVLLGLGTVVLGRRRR